MYNANAHVLLHEDTCFRFESQLGDGAFTVQLLEPDRSEVAPGERDSLYGTLHYVHGWQCPYLVSLRMRGQSKAARDSSSHLVDVKACAD